MARKGEFYKDVQGFEGHYKISNYGQVLSIARGQCKTCGHQSKKGMTLKCTPGPNGYKAVAMAKPGMGPGKTKTFTVHRLVALHFVDGMTEDKCVVNHKDGDKLNNHFQNLEWVTRSENCKHAYRIGLQVPWNKGLTTHTDQQERLQSTSRN